MAGTYDRMYDALATFETKLKQRGGIAFFHYGGHGLQVDGENYLLPVDKDIPDERRVRSRALNASEIVDLMAAAGSTTNILILDACRDNPLPAATRSGNSRGLAKLKAPVNTVVVYSAEAGDTAQDGVFTPTLLKYLEEPGLSFTEVLRKTRREVYDRTGGHQTPGAYDQLFDPIYLAGVPSGNNPESVVSSRSSSPASVAPTPTVPESFVLVKAGSFTMGSPANEIGRFDNETQHLVILTRDFYISTHEVTQVEYRSITGSNPSFFRGDNLPVEQVSWNDAVEYCNKLSQKEGLTLCYSGSGDSVRCNFDANGYRLPTEAEWEYAARGGQSAGLYQTYAGSNSISSAGWYADNSGNRTHPVSRKSSNSLGLYDLSGNVLEWCWDWTEDYNGSVTDPMGSSTGHWRVRRGGSWGLGSKYCRLGYHGTPSPGYSKSNLGFRVVRTAD